MRIQFLCSFYFDQGLVIGLISQIQLIINAKFDSRKNQIPLYRSNILSYLLRIVRRITAIRIHDGRHNDMASML